MGKNIVETLQERGLLFQVTDTDLAAAGEQQQLTVYCGFDPSAPSLQLGNLVAVMVLAHFQRHGHRPIILLGGGTGIIGDPSGKSSERALQSPDTIAKNAVRFKEQLSSFLSFEGPAAARVLNNYDWLGKYSLIEFLRDIGKHFSVSAMIAKESVRARLEEREQGISYTEFSYSLLQAADFLHLFTHEGCAVQVGGSDQWGNITAGIDLIRRKTGGTAHGLTAPLLTTADGQKFGKSEGNAVYLDPEMTSPYQMFQFWINTDDRDAERFLTIFSFLPLAEIAEIAAAAAGDPAARVLQRRLAQEVVTFVHGAETAAAVERAAAILFGEDPAGLSPAALAQILQAVPAVPIRRADLADGIPVLQAAVDANLVRSMSAGRTLVAQGGLYVNNRRWDDGNAVLTPADLLLNRAILLRSGRKTYHALVCE